MFPHPDDALHPQARDDIPPEKRHDGSLEAYRRQRRLVAGRKLEDSLHLHYALRHEPWKPQ